jgi:hypothetical protein
MTMLSDTLLRSVDGSDPDDRDRSDLPSNTARPLVHAAVARTVEAVPHGARPGARTAPTTEEVNLVTRPHRPHGAGPAPRAGVVATTVATIATIVGLWAAAAAAELVATAAVAALRAVCAPVRAAAAAVRSFRAWQDRLGAALFDNRVWRRVAMPLLALGVAAAGGADALGADPTLTWAGLVVSAFALGAGVVGAELVVERLGAAHGAGRPVRLPVALIAALGGVAAVELAQVAYRERPGLAALGGLTAASALLAVSAAQLVGTRRAGSWSHLAVAIVVVTWESTTFIDVSLPVAMLAAAVAVVPFAGAKYVNTPGAQPPVDAAASTVGGAGPPT